MKNRKLSVLIIIFNCEERKRKDVKNLLSLHKNRLFSLFARQMRPVRRDWLYFFREC